MSKTLSKILVICALAVVFPLMIVGTAFASFYSLDATLVVEAYAGIQNMPVDAFAQVKYDEETGKELTITKGHTSQIELNTLSEGYDFVGWYDGTVEEYAAETNPTFVSKDEKIKVKLSDYSNLVAVYQLKSYTITWNYLSNPENADNFSTNAPENSKSKYSWGDTLPVLEYAHYDFNGWTVEGNDEIFTKAKFENSGNLTLNADVSSWDAHGQVVINYYDENGNLINGASETVYKSEDYTLKNPADIASLESGYSYAWCDASNNIIDSVVNIAKSYEEQNVNFYLNKQIVNYSASLLANSDASYKGSANIQFTKTNTSNLEKLFDEQNWNMPYSFSKVSSIEFNSVNYAENQIANLVEAMIASKNENIEIKAVISQYSTFSAEQITYETTSGDGVVYEKIGDSYTTLYPTSATRDSSWTLETFLGIQGKTLTNSDNSSVIEYLEFNGLQVEFTNGTKLYYSVERFGLSYEMTMYDLIEVIVNDSRTSNISFANGDIFEISTLTAVFVS